MLDDFTNPPDAAYEQLDDVPDFGATGPVVINVQNLNLTQNVNVAPDPTAYGYELYSNKSRTLTLILAFLFGFFGLHCFYVGRPLRGLLFLLTLGILGFGWLYDVLVIAFGHFRDGNGLRIVNWTA